MKTKLFQYIIIGLVFPTKILAVGIDTEEDIREKYPLISREMCHSSLEYKLDMPFHKAKVQYNDKMTCLFESAFVTSTNQLNEEFRNKFFNRIFDPFISNPPIKDRVIDGEKCKVDELVQTFRSQKENGYKTLCKVDGRNSVAEKNYSACRVSEVAWNEYCAYQEYLKWKSNDESVVNEFTEEELADKERWNTYQNDKRGLFPFESDVSLRILEATLQQYQVFVQEYRLHLWQLVIAEALKVTRAQLKLAAEAIYKWPTKFPRASQ